MFANSASVVIEHSVYLQFTPHALYTTFCFQVLEIVM
jgi:hypothetical protein